MDFADLIFADFADYLTTKEPLKLGEYVRKVISLNLSGPPLERCGWWLRTRKTPNEVVAVGDGSLYQAKYVNLKKMSLKHLKYALLH